jgi:isoleucyl-tRNA synthetase
MRKEAGLAVSDRIFLTIAGTPEIEGAIRAHSEWIADEVLAKEIHVGSAQDQNHAVQTVDIDGQPVTIAFKRAG